MVLVPGASFGRKATEPDPSVTFWTPDSAPKFSKEVEPAAPESHEVVQHVEHPDELVAARDPELLAEQAEHDWADSVTEMPSEKPPSNSSYGVGRAGLRTGIYSGAGSEHLHSI